MTGRTVTLGMTFEADLTKARAEVDAFFKELKGRSARIPISTDLGGGAGVPGAPTTASTLGGMSTSMAATASPNWSYIAATMGREISQSVSAAIRQAMTGLPGGGISGSPGQPGQFPAQPWNPESIPSSREGGDESSPGRPAMPKTGGRERGLYGRRGILSNAFGGPTGGALAWTAAQIFSANREYAVQQELAGANSPSQSMGDQREQLQNELSYQKKIESVGFGILGGVAGFIADPDNSKRIGIERTVKSADIIDQTTRTIAEASEFRRQAASENEAKRDASLSPYTQKKKAIDRDYQNKLIKIKSEQDKESEPFGRQRDLDLQEASEDHAPIFDTDEQRDARAASRARKITSIHNRYHGIVEGIGRKFDKTRDDLDITYKSQLGEIDWSFRSDLRDIGNEDEEVSLRGNNRPNDAARHALVYAKDKRMKELRHSMADPRFIQSEDTLAQDRIDSYDKEQRRSIALGDRSVMAEASGAAHRAAGMPWTARMEAVRLKASQDIAQLPAEERYGERRGLILRREQAEEDDLRHDFGNADRDLGLNQSTRRNQIDALLRRDPIGAEVAGVVGGTQASMNRLKDQQFGRDRINEEGQLGVSQLQLTRQEYMDGFRGKQFDINNLDLSNRRDQEDSGKALTDIARGIDDLLKAIKDLGSD